MKGQGVINNDTSIRHYGPVMLLPGLNRSVPDGFFEGTVLTPHERDLVREDFKKGILEVWHPQVSMSKAGSDKKRRFRKSDLDKGAGHNFDLEEVPKQFKRNREPYWKNPEWLVGTVTAYVADGYDISEALQEIADRFGEDLKTLKAAYRAAREQVGEAVIA